MEKGDKRGEEGGGVDKKFGGKSKKSKICGVGGPTLAGGRVSEEPGLG